MNFEKKYNNILISFNRNKFKDKVFHVVGNPCIFTGSFLINVYIFLFLSEAQMIGKAGKIGVEFLIIWIVIILLIAYFSIEDTEINFTSNNQNLGTIDLLKVNEGNSLSFLKKILREVDKIGEDNLKNLSDIMKYKADIVSKTLFFNLKPSILFIINFMTLFGAAYIVTYNTNLNALKNNNLLEIRQFEFNQIIPWMAIIILIFIGIAGIQIYSLERVKGEYKKYYALKLLSKDLNKYYEISKGVFKMNKMEELNELKFELNEVLEITTALTKQIKNLAYLRIDLESALKYSEDRIEKCIKRIEKIENEINNI